MPGDYFGSNIHLILLDIKFQVKKGNFLEDINHTWSSYLIHFSIPPPPLSSKFPTLSFNNEYWKWLKIINQHKCEIPLSDQLEDNSERRRGHRIAGQSHKYSAVVMTAEVIRRPLLQRNSGRNSASLSLKRFEFQTKVYFLINSRWNSIN